MTELTIRPLVIKTVTLASPAGGGGGWIYIEDFLPILGTVTSKVFRDTGSTILESAMVTEPTFNVVVRACFPLVKINGVISELTRDVSGAFYAGSVPVTVTGSVATVRATVQLPDGTDGPYDLATATVVLPAQMITLQFSGGYPIGQTELKAGDTFMLTGLTDRAVNGVDILDYGACAASLVVVSAGSSFTVAGTIADRGTTVQALAARVRVRDAQTGAFSATRDTNIGAGTTDGVHTVKVNNLYPTAAFGSPTYPIGQGALKDSETATVPVTLADATTVEFDSPTGDVDVANPQAIEAVKTVTRIGGVHNETIPNLRVIATRAANGAVTTDDVIVAIVNVAPVLSITLPAVRLRSGGADGTVAQAHTITIVSDQELASAPTLLADGGGARGTFIGVGFVGGPYEWTRDLEVNDSDEKGTFTWGAISGTNKAGHVTTAITGSDSYVLGGFVSRDLTFPAFSAQAPIGVAVADFSKLQAGDFTVPPGTSVRQPIATPAPVSNAYTIVATGANPTQVAWLDTPAVLSNSTGTAQLLAIEEVI